MDGERRGLFERTIPAFDSNRIPAKYRINERVKVKSVSLKEVNREVRVNTPYSASNEMALRYWFSNSIRLTPAVKAAGSHCTNLGGSHGRPGCDDEI
jgi:hypothetical protein